MIANSQGMTIGRAAKAAGVPATTLRYYEREGLLDAPVRTTAGYRMYDDQAVERLRFIRAAQAVGFTLNDIRIPVGVPISLTTQPLQHKVGEQAVLFLRPGRRNLLP